MAVYDNMHYSYDSALKPTLMESYLFRKAMEKRRSKLICMKRSGS